MTTFPFLALDEVCESTLLMSIDDMIAHQKICNRYGTKNEDQPLCNAVYRHPASLARDVMELFYLKPSQYDLMFHGPDKLVVEGPVGTGKTIILLLKILYLLRSGSESNILLLAPYPHNVRCRYFLERNGVKVVMEEKLPLQPFSRLHGQNLSQPIVRILDLVLFGEECDKKSVVCGTSPFMEHVFFDDLQSMLQEMVDRNWMNLLQSLHQLCDMQMEGTFFWIAIDPQQGGFSSPVRDAIRKVFDQLPTHELNYVLRNSQPILEMVDTQYSAFSSPREIVINKGGHTINGPPVDIYAVINDNKASEEEVLPYLKATLHKILDGLHDVPTAILYDRFNDDYVKLCSSALKELGKETITIERYIEQGNELKASQVVFDRREYVPSFEMPLVVAISRRGLLTNSQYTESICSAAVFTSYQYILSSRARTKLVLIYFHCSLDDMGWMKENYPNAIINKLN